MKKFLEAVRESEELQNKLIGAEVEEVLAIAKERGSMFPPRILREPPLKAN